LKRIILKTIEMLENGAKRMKGINDMENGGEMEEGAELQCQHTVEIEVAGQTQKGRTESVEKGENSMADMRAMLLSITEMLKEDISERKEERREMRISLDKIVIDFQHRMNQRIQSKIDKVKIISERTHGQIQKSIETMQCSKSESTRPK
jgi:ElaB/YqjD/DUF883 family membrane-anchored ribosome-binding protein